MSRVREFGDAILAKQAEIGLENPSNLNIGLTELELAQTSLLQMVPGPSELHALFGWRNGVAASDLSMECLWIKPGFFLLSAQESWEVNQYLATKVSVWSPSWYPLLDDGGGSMLFFDAVKVRDGQVRVAYYFPDSSTSIGQMYDSIESMFETILECYDRRAYFLDSEGCLDRDFRKEVAISRRLNPIADYWQRGDLY